MASWRRGQCEVPDLQPLTADWTDGTSSPKVGGEALKHADKGCTFLFSSTGCLQSGLHSKLAKVGANCCSRLCTPTWVDEPSGSQLLIFLLSWKQQWRCKYFCHVALEDKTSLSFFLIGWQLYDHDRLWGIYDEHPVKGSQLCSPLPATVRQEVIWILHRKKQDFCWPVWGPSGLKSNSGFVHHSDLYLLLQHGRTDIGMANLWIRTDTFAYFDFSVPYNYDGLCFLIPLPEETTDYLALLRPMSLATW